MVKTEASILDSRCGITTLVLEPKNFIITNFSLLFRRCKMYAISFILH